MAHSTSVEMQPSDDSLESCVTDARRDVKRARRKYRRLLAASPHDAQATQGSHDPDRRAPPPTPEAAFHCRACGGPLVFLSRLVPQKRRPPECARGDPPHGRASSGLRHARRRAHPSWHGLIRWLVPAHATPDDACPSHQGPQAHAPLPDGVDAGLGPLASSWRPACTTLPRSAAAPPSP